MLLILLSNIAFPFLQQNNVAFGEESESAHFKISGIKFSRTLSFSFLFTFKR